VSTTDLVLVVDLALSRGSATTRVRTCHSWQGRRVEVLRVAGGETWRESIDVRKWGRELERICQVPVPDDVPPPPPDEPDLPWDLVVGTGAAFARHRADLAAELLARVDAPLRAQVDRLHRATLGRLRVVGTVPSRRRVGRLSWVLFADGWRALTPYAGSGPDGPRAMLRLERRAPEDLARDVARWVA
jgi:hypothetical protein